MSPMPTIEQLEVISPALTPLRDEHEQNVARALMSNISSHNDSIDGFTLLEHNPDLYSFQRLDCIAMKGKNATADELRSLASFVYPRFEEIIDKFAKRPDLLNHAAYLLLNGGEMGVATDHFKSVIGVAVVGCSFVCALYENTPVTPEDIDINLIVSCFIKYTNLQGFKPTSIVLSEVVSQTTYTLPPSPSNREQIDPEIRQPVNEESMRYRDEGTIEEQEEEPGIEEESGAKKGRLTVYAGSGGRDFTVPAHMTEKHRPVPRTTHMGPMAFGTADMVMSMPTLGVGIDISQRRPKLYIGSLPPRPAQHSFEADALMNSTAHGMSTPTHPRLYHSSRETFYAVIEQAKAMATER